MHYSRWNSGLTIRHGEADLSSSRASIPIVLKKQPVVPPLNHYKYGQPDYFQESQSHPRAPFEQFGIKPERNEGSSLSPLKPLQEKRHRQANSIDFFQRNVSQSPDRMSNRSRNNELLDGVLNTTRSTLFEHPQSQVYFGKAQPLSYLPPILSNSKETIPRVAHHTRIKSLQSGINLARDQGPFNPSQYNATGLQDARSSPVIRINGLDRIEEVYSQYHIPQESNFHLKNQEVFSPAQRIDSRRSRMPQQSLGMLTPSVERSQVINSVMAQYQSIDHSRKAEESPYDLSRRHQVPRTNRAEESPYLNYKPELPYNSSRTGRMISMRDVIDPSLAYQNSERNAFSLERNPHLKANQPLHPPNDEGVSNGLILTDRGLVDREMSQLSFFRKKKKKPKEISLSIKSILPMMAMIKMRQQKEEEEENDRIFETLRQQNAILTTLAQRLNEHDSEGPGENRKLKKKLYRLEMKMNGIDVPESSGDSDSDSDSNDKRKKRKKKGKGKDFEKEIATHGKAGRRGGINVGLENGGVDLGQDPERKRQMDEIEKHYRIEEENIKKGKELEEMKKKKEKYTIERAKALWTRFRGYFWHKVAFYMFKSALTSDMGEKRAVALEENAKMQIELISLLKGFVKKAIENNFNKSIANSKTVNVVSAPDKIKPYGQKPPSNVKTKAKELIDKCMDILAPLGNASRVMDPKLIALLARITMNRSFPLQGFFFEGELGRLDFTFFGSLKNQDAKRVKMLVVGAIFFHTLIGDFLRSPWESFPSVKSPPSDLLRLNLRNICSVIFWVFSENIRNQVPFVKNNQKQLTMDLRVKPRPRIKLDEILSRQSSDKGAYGKEIEDVFFDDVFDKATDLAPVFSGDKETLLPLKNIANGLVDDISALVLAKQTEFYKENKKKEQALRLERRKKVLDVLKAKGLTKYLK